MVESRTRLGRYEASANFERTEHVSKEHTYLAKYKHTRSLSKLQTHIYIEPPTHPAIVLHPPPLAIDIQIYPFT